MHAKSHTKRPNRKVPEGEALICVRVEEDLKNTLEALAHELDLTMSQILRRGIRDFIQQHRSGNPVAH